MCIHMFVFAHTTRSVIFMPVAVFFFLISSESGTGAGVNPAQQGNPVQVSLLLCVKGHQL